MTGPSLHVVETLTGRITDTLDDRDGVTGLRWTDTLNGTGSIDSVTVPESVVRDLQLRQRTHGMRTSLAVERDGYLKQAGPITSRSWDWERGQATFGAQGIWHWLDRRIISSTSSTPPLQAQKLTVAGKSLGGIGRYLVYHVTQVHGALYAPPIVLPADEAGDRTETFPQWKLLRVGPQLREITQRETAAPDFAFPARRRTDDARSIEWVMRAGTEAKPALSQGGPDWVFDASAPKSPVLGISTDEDATQMGTNAWVTGIGQEEDILMSLTGSVELPRLGWLQTDVDESRPSVEVQATLDGHAASLLARRNRPVEKFKVAVRAEAARQVQAGDYCRVVTRGDSWLGDMDRTMRVKSISGDLSDTVQLDMFPMAALL